VILAECRFARLPDPQFLKEKIWSVDAGEGMVSPMAIQTESRG
jgi:hypothetical protein